VFFQASATIIPTLFIALAFTSRLLAQGSDSGFATSGDGSRNYRRTLSVVVVPISSEAVALATLSVNRPTYLAQAWVLVGIFGMLGYLLLAVTAPFRESMYHRWWLTAFWGTVMPIIVFLTSADLLRRMP
jgi:hypothetical protein